MQFPRRNCWFNTVSKKELLVQYGSQEGTAGSIPFPRRNSWFNTVPKNKPLVQYSSQDGTLGSIRFRRRNPGSIWPEEDILGSVWLRRRNSRIRTVPKELLGLYGSKD
jgi:hypothetical protein